MKEICKFIVEYWYIISAVISVFLFILTFIFSLFKKGKIEVFDTSIYSQLIALVNEAENIFKKGEDKKKYVVDTFVKRNYEKIEVLAKYYRSPFTKYKSAVDDFKMAISGMVESILSTPQKKDVKKYEETIY